MVLNTLNKKISFSNPNKNLWINPDISKLEFAKLMLFLSPYIIKHTKGRLLTAIRYPHGVDGDFFYQKNIPDYAPDWVSRAVEKDTEYIDLDNENTLMWLCNLASIEYHISFHEYKDPAIPVYITFDLDPSEGVSFEQVREGCMHIYAELKRLNIKSIPKTSGATGVQILIPHGKHLDYKSARAFNEFMAKYFTQKYPKIFTIERAVKKRGLTIYFDYLQMWPGKSIIAPYSPRARKGSPISMPLRWKELENGAMPKDFNLSNAKERLEKNGDLLADFDQVTNDSVISLIKEITVLH